MHDWVAKKLADVLLPEEACLRGERVLFIPCKSPKSLNHVKTLVTELLEDKRLKLTKASLPFSRKNQKQFKGFLLYLEFATMEQVNLVKDDIFPSKFGKIFQKCVIAPPRNNNNNNHNNHSNKLKNQNMNHNIKKQTPAIALTYS
eukprot:UN24295